MVNVLSCFIDIDNGLQTISFTRAALNEIDRLKQQHLNYNFPHSNVEVKHAMIAACQMQTGSVKLRVSVRLRMTEAVSQPDRACHEIAARERSILWLIPVMSVRKKGCNRPADKSR